MPSKQVTDREKSARAVCKAAQTHAGDAAAGVADVLSQYLQANETMPDVALLCALVRRWIEDKSRALTQADRAHEHELADDAGPRAARDQAADQIRDALVALRNAVDAVYDQPGMIALAIDDAVSADPSVLAAAAGSAITALRDPAVALPPARTGMQLDREVCATALEAHQARLAAALDDVARERREAETTLVAKHEAMAANDAAFSRAASWLTATFALAGLDELADRVRPSGRRPGRTADQLETADSPEAGSDPEAGGTATPSPGAEGNAVAADSAA